MGNSKVILITGCNNPRGVGYATAHELAGKGHVVYATVRGPEREKDLKESIQDKDNIFIKYLDITQESMIIDLVKQIIDEQKRIDILINNAGYGLFGAIEQTDIEQAKREYDVNLFGAIRLIQEVLPYMRAAKQGHIINISAILVTSHSIPTMGFYIGTKAALETISQALAVEVAQWNIHITNFQPGPIRTGLSKEFGHRLEKDQDPYQDTLDRAFRWIKAEAPPFVTAPEIAHAISKLVANNHPDIMTQNNQASQEFVAKRRKDPTGNQDFHEILKYYLKNP